jgi:hypothetical protein
MKNNSTSTRDEDYFNDYNFLQLDDTKAQNKIENDDKTSSTKKSNYRPKNSMTLDVASSSEKQVDLQKAAHSILTEESNQGENMFMLKSAIQQSLESPELNKKLRAQQEYNKLNAIKDNPEKKGSIKKDIENIIFQENFDISKFKDDKEKNNEIKNEIKQIISVEPSNSPDLSEDKRQKIYKIKKKKQIINEQTPSIAESQTSQMGQINLEPETIQEKISISKNIDKISNSQRLNYLMPFIFTSTIFLGFLYRKKITNYFKIK